MATDVNTILRVSRLASSPAPDNTLTIGQPQRGGRYGEVAVLSYVPTKHLLADEGNYWVATTPTPGTAVTYALQTSFSDTAGLILVTNTDTPGPNARRVYLDYLRLICVAVGSSASSVQFAVKTDGVPRIPTANSTGINPVNTNSDVQNTNQPCTVYIPNAGALTLPAATNAGKLVARGSVRQVLPVILDELVVAFGDNPPGGVVGSTAGRFVSHAAPVVIGPQQSAAIYLWEPSVSTTTPTFEIELGLWAR